MTATKAVRFDMIFKRKNKEKPIKANREIMTITCIFAALFIALIGYIAYFTAFKSDVFINNTYNNLGLSLYFIKAYTITHIIKEIIIKYI